jgi:hypothetical protein
MAGDGLENRRAPRRQVQGHATVRAPGLEVSCVIRDLSATGARIEVPSSVHLPDEFNLLLAEAKSSRHVHLRWRRGDFAGVEFDRANALKAMAALGDREQSTSPARASQPQSQGPSTGKGGGPEQRRAPRLRVLGHCVMFYMVDRKQRTVRKALLRWRKKEFAGVEFCQSPAKPAEKQLAKDLENAWFV